MKTDTLHEDQDTFLKYIAHFFVECAVSKVVEKIKTHILCLVTFSENPAVWDVKKFCRAKRATDDNIIRRMLIACWMTKATNTHTQVV